MADTPITVGVGSLGFNGRGATGGIIVTGEHPSHSGWGVGLSFIGQSAALSQTANHVIEVPIGSLGITGTISTIKLAITRSPTLVQIAFTGIIPTLGQTANHTRAPPIGALALTGAAPTLSQTANHTISPSKGSLAVSGKTPTIDRFISVPVGSLALTGTVSTLGVSKTLTPSLGSITFSSDVVSLSYSIVYPSLGSISFTGIAPTVSVSGSAAVITVGAPDALALTGIAPVTQVGATALPSVASLSLTGQGTTIAVDHPIPMGAIDPLAFLGYAVTTEIANSGTAIVNANATTDVPSNYEQCDYTGFRQLKGSLKMTWNKYAVRKKSWEERNPQDYVRSRPEIKKGPKRPEQDDRFIEDIGEVSAEDL